MALLGDGDGVDHAAGAHCLALAQRQFGIEEGEVEPRIMRHQRRIADEVEQFVRNVAEQRLVRQERGRQPVHGFRAGGHVAFRIVIGVIGRAGGHEIEQFDTAYFDHPVAGPWIQPGGFGVEDDLAHWPDYRTRAGGLQEV